MKKFLLLLSIVTMLFSASQTNALVIDVSPDTSPAGYVPLSLFNVAPIAGVGDESITNFNVGSFIYAGETWNRVGVVSNGYIVVGGGTGADVSIINQLLPDSTMPNNVLAPFWTDLNAAAGGAIRIANLTDGGDTWLVTDWESVPNYSNSSELNSFQVWIGINSVEDITFTYGLVSSGDLGYLTVGAEDKTGTVGDYYYRDGIGTLPTRATELRVTTSGAPVPEPSTMLLLGAGLLVFAGATNRKQKK